MMSDRCNDDIVIRELPQNYRNSMIDGRDSTLNYYSKYTRAKEKQPIHSLYSLIDSQHPPSAQFTLQLNCSQIHPEQLAAPTKRSQEEDEVLLQFVEARPRVPPNEKAARLDQMQDDFYYQMQKREQEYRQRRQALAQQRKSKSKGKATKQFITVVQHAEPEVKVEQSPKETPVIELKRVVSEEEVEAQDGIVFVKRQKPIISPPASPKQAPGPPKAKEQEAVNNIVEVRGRLQSLTNEKHPKIVESVEDQHASSSIVIERGQPKKPSNPKLEEAASKKDSKNLYEVELNHSQSEKLLHCKRQEKSETEDVMEVIEVQAAEPNLVDTRQISRPPGILTTKETGLYSIEPSQPFQYFKTDPLIEPQVTSSQPKNEQTSFKEQEADRVLFTSVEKRSPLFYSVKRHGLQKLPQKNEVVSIANDESLDHHPLDSPVATPLASPPDLIHQQTGLMQEPSSTYQEYQVHSPEAKSRTRKESVGEKAQSFKKIMAANRANLVPRLAISTILNEHINEALGDYRNNSPCLLEQSVVESEEQLPKKVNFKRMMSKAERKSPQVSALSARGGVKKSQGNRKLLCGFFDEN